MLSEVVASWQIGTSGERLILSRRAYEHLVSHLQIRAGSTEAGGPLFSVVKEQLHVICDASGPFRNDHRRKFFFMPHRNSTQLEINRRHALGQHFIGTWHSHPEEIPSPSNTDLTTMRSIFAASDHDLHSMVMIILGKSREPATWHVSVHSSKGWSRLVIVDIPKSQRFCVANK